LAVAGGGGVVNGRLQMICEFKKIIEECWDIKKSVFLPLKHWLMVATW
jgi:hypothetical protein